MSYDRLVQVADGVLVSPFHVVAVSRTEKVFGLEPFQTREFGSEIVYAGGARVFVLRMEPGAVLAAIGQGERTMNWCPTTSEGDGGGR